MNKILGLIPVFGLVACDQGVPDSPEVTTRIPPSPGSDCGSCHPRQFREWAGSSHNYGGGLDPTYQALEITANYVASAAGQGPIFRQAVLCVQCHAPTAGVIEDGRLNPNASFRAANANQTRELRLPDGDEILLEPPGKATEEQAGEGDAIFARRRITYQGITCDSCHKVGQPFDDLQHEDAGQVCSEETPECAARLRAQCEEKDDIRCRRISRGGHHDHEDFFEKGIANVAIAYEKEGTTRYGPFFAGDAAENIAHEVSAGATPEAQEFVISYPGQPMDARPYLQTPQFCGACHDVRLPIDNPATPEVEIEPIHDEPFLRLENLYTEWLVSPLNLHPDADPRDNPYLDENNMPKRIVCQDCHMSLFPYAPPGTYPGDYTAGEMDCDPNGVCGSQIALSEVDGTPTTLSNLRVPHRPRVTTHNMTGVDIRMGNIAPTPSLLGYDSPEELPKSLTLPAQVEADAPAQDPDYGLPVSLDQRRKQQLEHSITLSLGGTPDTIDFEDRDCSDGLCCDADGHCNLPIKAWLTNVNGGHNVAAGFSQERQIWLELTVQDMGKDGAPVVDCALADLDDLYTDVTMDGRYPRFDMHPKPHTATTANDVMDRLFGNGDHYMICRGMSGHLYDKPHDETGESVADGSLHDEDILLHRIGNTLPETVDGDYLLSWHILDLGQDPNDPAGPLDLARVNRPDQFHIPGNDPFNCELSRKGHNPNLVNGTAVTFDPATGAKSTVPLSSLGELTYAVTETPDERLEILYPFPEFKPLLPYVDGDGHLHAGDRFGLVYATNIFYRICGCPLEGDETCEGPHEISPEFSDSPAQVPWLMTYPTLPSLYEHQDENTEDYLHFPVDSGLFADFMTKELGMPGGTPATESFTFVPLNPNHMPNNRSLKFYQPQRHYWDIRVERDEVVGPLRVSVKAWYRHFPPEFLRLMARVAEQAYQRAEALGRAEELFPHGPLMVEGQQNTAAYPQTGNVDNVKRFILDQSVFYVDVGGNNAADERIAIPETPTWERNVQPIIQDHCLPCHSDVLRHGKLVMGYDDHPQWDDPAFGERLHEAQDPLANLIGASSNLAEGETLVIPGNAEASWLYKVLTEDEPHERVRRMPLKTDRLSDRELETIRRWIDTNAQR